MILLEAENKIIAEAMQSRLDSFNPSAEEKPDSMDIQLADFDGVTYRISTPDASNRNRVRLSMNMQCYTKDLLQYGAAELLKREYGAVLQPKPEPNFDVTLEFDVATIAAQTPDQKAAFVKKLSLLKCNAMSAPFERAFDDQLAGRSSAGFMTVHYRDQEAMYIKASQDRVTVIFSTLFKDETDKIFGKVFLQEFVDCRRQPALQNAPQALYTNREPPLELKGVQDLKVGDNVGYVTFVLFPRHFQTPQQRTATIQLIQHFRDYLHYHIKCSKAYMHSRMRAKVESWLKVLNRAKPEEDKERKLASGKTFVRKV